MEDLRTLSLLNLTKALVPIDRNILRSVTVGTDKLSDFYRVYYMDDYIANGGSAVRFVTGKKGSGKSHLLALLCAEASEAGYKTVEVDASSVLLNDFTELYKAVFGAVDFRRVIQDVCQNLMRNMGFSQVDMGLDISAVDQLSNMGQLDALSRNELRARIREISINNPFMDSNFAIIVSLLVSARTGLFRIDPSTEQRLMRWLEVDKTLSVTEFKQDGLLPYRINRYNARFMLRSFSELCKVAGYTGLFIAVDNLDSMLNSSSVSEIHYTKMRRDDTYESIRQLVDDVDSFHNFCIFFAMNSEMLINEKAGIKSYQALWLRIQNEIVTDCFNPFSSLLDMDKANKEYLTEEALVEMSEKLCSMVHGIDISTSPISREKAAEIIRTARYGGNAVPYLVNHATVGFVGRE